MDLRERRSLTYGAYSRVFEAEQVGAFRAYASVRTDVTGEAVGAFFEHLDRIRTEATPADELLDAQRFLSDSFPLEIDTPGKIAGLVADLRVFGLADDYYDTFRTRIREVEAPQALAAAQAHIRPAEALVVIVGKAADIVDGLRQFGPVIVVDENGDEKERFEAVAPGAAAETAPAEGGEGENEQPAETETAQ
jgi:zinc protease